MAAEPIVKADQMDNDSLWTIPMNRPSKRNAYNTDSQKALYSTFIPVSFEKDSYSKIAILRGGDGNFCAGADLEAAIKQNKSQMIKATPLINVNDDINSNKSKTISGYLDSMGFMGISRLLSKKPKIGCISDCAVVVGLELALPISNWPL